MHQCVRCGNTYHDNDANILRGCAKCGAIFFLYIKTPEDAQQLDAVQQELEKKDTTLEKELIKEIEKKKVEEIKKPAEKEVERKVEAEPEIEVEFVEAGDEAEVIKKDREGVKERPVQRRGKRKEVVRVGKTKFALEDSFGIETIRVPKDGVYEIIISALMKKRPIIVLERGKVYFIHLPTAFKKS